MTTFAQRLTQLRRKAGLSQTDIAGERLSPSYVSLLEAGKRQPSDEVLQLLAQRLNCSVSVLKDGLPEHDERQCELELAYCKLALNHGEANDARTRLQALADSPQIQAFPAIGHEASFLLATAHEKAGDLRAAVTVLQPVFDACVQHHSTLSVAVVGLNLCAMYADCGDVHRAVTVGEQALEQTIARGLRGSDDYFRLCATLLGAYLEIGDLTHAVVWAQTLVAEAEQHATRAAQAAILWNAAAVAETLGYIDEAIALIERSLAHMSEGGSTRDVSRLHIMTASLLLEAGAGRAGEALQLLERSQSLVSDLGSQADVAQWERAYAHGLLLHADYEKAEQYATQAVDRLADQQRSDLLATALMTQADSRLAQGQSLAAHEGYVRATTVLHDAPVNRSTAHLWRELGDRLQEHNEPLAVSCFQRSLSAAGIHDRSSPLRAAIAAAAVEACAARL